MVLRKILAYGLLIAFSPHKAAAVLKMAKKKFTKSKGETRTSFMFPSLHEDVVNAVSHSMSSTWFCESDSDRGVNNKYSTHVMGKLRCKNACGTNIWSSKKVAILIRGYAENGYKCCSVQSALKDLRQARHFDSGREIICRTSRIQNPEVGGRSSEQQHHASKGGKPHKREFCEGCKRGVCRQTNGWEYN